MSPPPKDPIKYGLYIQRQSESHMGHISSRKGKTHTQESIEKMSLSKQGMYDGEKNPFYNKKHTQESIELICNAAQKRGDDWKEKLRQLKLGTHPSEQTRKKLSDNKKGCNNNFYGKHHTEDTRMKMSEMKLGCKAPNWKGGTSFRKYCYKFNARRKKAVRKFFNYRCICCGKHESENIIGKRGQIALSVHHIDHDKNQGCGGIPFNLVTMCAECHGKEVTREEEYKKSINKQLDSGFEWGIWSREQYEIEVMYPE